MRCANSTHCSAPPARAPAFTASNSWGQRRQGLDKLATRRCHRRGAGEREGRGHLLVGQRVERRHRHVEQRLDPLERRQRGKAHVELQQVNLGQADGHHLQRHSGRSSKEEAGQR